MEIDKNVANPMLVGAMQLFKAEDTPEHRNMLMSELAKATLLTPALIDPAPAQAADGSYRLEKGSRVQFPILNGSDGKRFFVAYTDERSLRAGSGSQQVGTPKEYRDHFVTMQITDFAGILLTKDANGNSSPCNGFVLNPFAENVIISSDAVAVIIGQLRGNAPWKSTEG